MVESCWADFLQQEDEETDGWFFFYGFHYSIYQKLISFETLGLMACLDYLSYYDSQLKELSNLNCGEYNSFLIEILLPF